MPLKRSKQDLFGEIWVEVSHMLYKCRPLHCKQVTPCPLEKLQAWAPHETLHQHFSQNQTHPNGRRAVFCIPRHWNDTQPPHREQTAKPQVAGSWPAHRDFFPDWCRKIAHQLRRTRGAWQGWTPALQHLGMCPQPQQGARLQQGLGRAGGSWPSLSPVTNARQEREAWSVLAPSIAQGGVTGQVLPAAVSEGTRKHILAFVLALQGKKWGVALKQQGKRTTSSMIICTALGTLSTLYKQNTASLIAPKSPSCGDRQHTALHKCIWYEPALAFSLS